MSEIELIVNQLHGKIPIDVMYLPRPSTKYSGCYPKYFEKHLSRLLETDNYIHFFGGKDGPTAWARKAIEQSKKGKSSFLTLPTQSYVNLLLEAGAELRSLGRVKWLEVDSKEPMKGPSSITGFYLPSDL